MTALLKLALGIAAAAVAMAVSGQVAAAASPPTLKLSVAARPDDAAKLALTARLQGTLPAGAAVDFFVDTDQYGNAMEVPLGSSEVANGAATLVYAPTWSGQQRFVARLAGSADVEAAASYNVTVSAPGPLYAHANQPRPFAGAIGETFLAVLLAAVALVWLTLIVTLVRVAWGLPRLA